jgi:hypothetical protein
MGFVRDNGDAQKAFVHVRRFLRLTLKLRNELWIVTFTVKSDNIVRRRLGR